MIMNKPSLLIPCVLLPLFLLVHSSIAQSQTETSVRHQNLKYVPDGMKNNEESQTVFNRQQWHLDEKEWNRYQQLMKGVRGSISPATISPIEVLGTHARTETERMKYARKWAKIMFEDAGRVLEFQRAYSQAFKEEYGNIPLIDVSKLGKPKAQQTRKINDHDRLLVFVKMGSCPACEQLMANLLATAGNKDVQIDIFFVDAKTKKDDSRIRHWAVKHKLNKDKLKARKITLNYNKGELFNITKNLTTPLPIVFKTNQNKTVQLFI